jgi:AraC-like DNA-binding protein/mannose-6-phosphate isomerase-like protein (cupin superfamily)
MKTHIVKCDFPEEKVGLRTFRNQKNSILHTHEFDEIAFVIKGSAIHEIGGNRYPIMRGDVFVIHGNQVHKISNTNNLTILNIIYEKEFFEKIKEEYKDTPGFSALFIHEPLFREKQKFNAFLQLSSRQFQNIEDLLTIIDKEQVERETGFKEIIASVFVQTILTLCRYYHKTDSFKSKGMLKISAAINYIENNFSKNITIAKLCEITELPETTFRRTFKKITGSLPIDYLVHIRIEKAAEMMREKPGLHVVDVCISSGFENTGYFSRKFKKIIGVTPIQYLKKQRGIGKWA